MSSLIALGFDGIHTADEVLNKARSMQKEHLIDLEDAAWSSARKTARYTSSRPST